MPCRGKSCAWRWVLCRARDLRSACLVELLLRERLHVLLGARSVAWQVAREEDEVEGRHQIIDALHVSRGWMAQRPNVKDALERTLHDGVPKDLDRGRSARNVDQDLCTRGETRLWMGLQSWVRRRATF
jgi:hypothetical protein